MQRKSRFLFIYFVTLVALPAVLVSCASDSESGFSVPGARNAIYSTIYTEYFTIAEEYMNLGNYAKAITYYKLAMQNKTLNTPAYYGLGRAYAMNKNFSEAESVYENLLKKDPANRDLRLSFAYVVAMKGDTQKALSLYEKLLTDYPHDAEIQKNYIVLLYAANDYEEVSRQIQKFETEFGSDDKITAIKERLSSGSAAEEPDKQNQAVVSSSKQQLPDGE